VDPSEPQKVKQDGEQHNQKTDKKQIVIVNKGEAPPVGVTSTEVFLLDVSEKDQRDNRHQLQIKLCCQTLSTTGNRAHFSRIVFVKRHLSYPKYTLRLYTMH